MTIFPKWTRTVAFHCLFIFSCDNWPSIIFTTDVDLLHPCSTQYVSITFISMISWILIPASIVDVRRRLDSSSSAPGSGSPSLWEVAPAGLCLHSSSSAPGSGSPCLWEVAPAGLRLDSSSSAPGSGSLILWEFAPAGRRLDSSSSARAVAPRSCGRLPPPARSWFLLCVFFTAF